MQTAVGEGRGEELGMWGGEGRGVRDVERGRWSGGGG